MFCLQYMLVNSPSIESTVWAYGDIRNTMYLDVFWFAIIQIWNATSKNKIEIKNGIS